MSDISVSVEGMNNSSAFNFREAIRSEYAQGEFKNSFRKLYEVHNKCCEINGYKNDVVKSPFRIWSANVIERGMFKEGFSFVKKITKPQKGTNGGRPIVDYICTDDIIKEVCMLFDTIIGKQIRGTYLEYEKAFLSGRTALSMHDIVMQLAKCPTPIQKLVEDCTNTISNQAILIEQKETELKDANIKNAKQAEKIKKNKPKVEFAEALDKSEQERTLTEIVMECLKFGSLSCQHPNLAIREMVKAKIIYWFEGIGGNNHYKAYSTFKQYFREVEREYIAKNGILKYKSELVGKLTSKLREKIAKHLNPSKCPLLYVVGTPTKKKCDDIIRTYEAEQGLLFGN